ncbi:MAG: TIR domain-containing protein [Bacteroidetes bacterium]|nr:TIR domain-containing protein [Bacteroidota bacterium]
MLARTVYFSFDYNRDIDRVNQIRNMSGIQARSSGGFTDATFWNDAVKKGDSHVAQLIQEGLKNTVVTIVCIGAVTAQNKYVEYEINQSLKRGNAIIAITIHHLGDNSGKPDVRGAKPYSIEKNAIPVYKYEDHKSLLEEISRLARTRET